MGVARTDDAVRSVVLRGAGAPRPVAVSEEGAFAAVLPPTTQLADLRLEVTLKDGTVQRARPGEGLTPDPVKSRRAR